MGQISVSLPSDGSTADVADYNSPITTIVNEVNSNLDNSNIKAGAAIDPTKLASSGFLGAWQSWTPTWTNLSGGTLNYARYIQIGKTVHFRLKYTLGGAGVSGNVSFTAPVEVSTGYADQFATPMGTATYIDNGVGSFEGSTKWADSSTTIALRVRRVSGSNIANTALSSTVPFTWASSDVILAEGTYEAA